MGIKHLAARSGECHKQHSKFDNIENPPSLVNLVTDGHSDMCPSLFFVCIRATHYFTLFSTIVLEKVLRFLVAESSKSSKAWLEGKKKTKPNKNPLKHMETSRKRCALSL